MLMLLVLGFIALGVEISQLLLEHRKQQTVADSAAMAAASAVRLGVTDLQGEARAMAASLGYRNGVNGVTVTAVNPPATGAHVGDAKYVEVTVQRSFTPALIQLFHQGAFTVRARAVASAGASGSAVCMVVLDGSSSEAVTLTNHATINLPDCGIAVNSTSNSAVRMTNNATIAGNLTMAGAMVTTNQATVTGTVTDGASPGTDPYADISPGTPTETQEMPSLEANSKVTLDPGLYENGWNFWGDQEITLSPGIYYVRNNLDLRNSVKVTGTDVTIVIDGSYAIGMSNNTQLKLTARKSGPTAGVAIYSAKSAADQSFSNHATLNVTGALYFPKQKVQFSNNTTISASSCTQLIARQLQMSNNAEITLKGVCSGAGVSELGSSSNASLAE